MEAERWNCDVNRACGQSVGVNSWLYHLDLEWFIWSFQSQEFSSPPHAIPASCHRCFIVSLWRLMEEVAPCLAHSKHSTNMNCYCYFFSQNTIITYILLVTWFLNLEIYHERCFWSWSSFFRWMESCSVVDVNHVDYPRKQLPGLWRSAQVILGRTVLWTDLGSGQ